MKLAAYLETTGLSYAEFARRIGASHRRTVERYAKGERIPVPPMMRAITAESGGKVQANDFFVEAE